MRGRLSAAPANATSRQNRTARPSCDSTDNCLPQDSIIVAHRPSWWGLWILADPRYGDTVRGRLPSSWSWELILVYNSFHGTQHTHRYKHSRGCANRIAATA